MNHSTLLETSLWFKAGISTIFHRSLTVTIMNHFFSHQPLAYYQRQKKMISHETYVYVEQTDETN